MMIPVLATVDHTAADLARTVTSCRSARANDVLPLPVAVSVTDACDVDLVALLAEVVQANPRRR